VSCSAWLKAAHTSAAGRDELAHLTTIVLVAEQIVTVQEEQSRLDLEGGIFDQQEHFTRY
jgi:hypothetical protein